MVGENTVSMDFSASQPSCVRHVLPHVGSYWVLIRSRHMHRPQSSHRFVIKGEECVHGKIREIHHFPSNIFFRWLFTGTPGRDPNCSDSIRMVQEIALLRPADWEAQIESCVKPTYNQLW